MINVRIDENDLLDMLSERVRYWRDGEEAELFIKMYENMIDNDYFEGAEFNINSIVDNDVVNWCSVIDPSDKDFKKLLKLYKKGERDVSCEHLDCGASYIEAVSDDESMILIRQ